MFFWLESDRSAVGALALRRFAFAPIRHVLTALQRSRPRRMRSERRPIDLPTMSVAWRLEHEIESYKHTDGI
jgi:hypothetical protein